MVPLPTMNLPPAISRLQRVRQELTRRDLKVVRAEAISPHSSSVTSAGDSSFGFVSASFDDHLKFMLDADGAAPVRRDDTPRRAASTPPLAI